ncbi:hypothetical protein BD410DRAFT_560618 [Rickenella mellea]|uniref:Uncharacterized protein n=1 Tax=Rickenella mellea TaxID=50990 RepID=A0A4Y7QEE1_9AGAM|nr:hypothetical protein BD410DRAFT_560618 [Rickenella mellea]
MYTSPHALLLLTSFFVTSLGAPTHNSLLNRADVTATQIQKFAPGSATCAAGGQFADECRTADQVVPLLNDAFNEFGIATVGERAAIASLMSFETGDFKFDRNHFPPPGKPGQGTRNLMTFPFIMKYAQNTTATAAKADALSPNPATADDATKNAVLALMLPDDLSFASASWFYTNQCDQSIVQGLQSATESGWENYITECVGTTVTDDRKTAYLAALSAMS